MSERDDLERVRGVRIVADGSSRVMWMVWLNYRIY